MQINRRDFMTSSLIAAAGLTNTLGTIASGANEERDKYPIIDAHTHFYDPSRPEGIPWPSKEDSALYRTVLPPEFRRATAPYGVTGTVIIEASPWVEDNQWLLDLADADPFVAGIVGNLSPGEESFGKLLARFSKNPLYRGIRIGSDLLASGLEKPSFLADLRKMNDANLQLDVNGGIESLPLVDRLAKLLPDFRIAINHLANVRIDGKEPPAEWSRGLKDCAAHQNVFLKVSALTEGARTAEHMPPVETDYYRPILETAWKTFGEDRLIYGSDWPVSDRAAPYKVVIQIVKDFFGDKGQTATEKFFAKNATVAYGLRART
ncbi:amidohydrolase family protein [Schlesneria sp. T3-172]|uniref:amidohydrolase family protein n=1 Tax=Schlesneria sphaerica TaxID=3373610 RepID=UPI0037CB11D4